MTQSIHRVLIGFLISLIAITMMMMMSNTVTATAVAVKPLPQFRNRHISAELDHDSILQAKQFHKKASLLFKTTSHENVVDHDDDAIIQLLVQFSDNKHDFSTQSSAIVGHLQSYLGRNTYTLKTTISQIERIRKDPHVAWVGHYKPQLKFLERHMTVEPQRVSDSIAQLGGDSLSRMMHTQAQLFKSSERTKKSDPRFTFKRESTGDKMIALSVMLEAQPSTVSRSINALHAVKRVQSQLSSLLLSNDISMESLLIASDKKLVITVPESQILHAAQVLASHYDVHWVEPMAATTTTNKWSRWITQTGNSNSEPLTKSELRGQGQIVGIGDSGLDYNSCYFQDPDHGVSIVTNVNQPKKSVPHRKIHEIWALVDDIAEGRAHGTHVAGSVLGSPIKTLNSTQYNKFNEHSGMAPEAKVLFTDIGCLNEDGCQCHGVPCVCDLFAEKRCRPSERAVYPPLDLNSGLFPYSYESGARIHTNSWGGGSGWGYGISSMEIDQFSWEHKDFLILFAAGNSGDTDGYGSLGIEAESKNAIAVGATMNHLSMFQFAAENDDYEKRAKYISSLVLDALQCDFTECNNFTQEHQDACNFWRNFTAAQCCSTEGQCVSQGSCGCSLYNVGSFCCQTCVVRNLKNNIFAEFEYSPENAAYFSSRGPTTDLRIKPDICAPGHSVISARSFDTKTNPRVCSSNSQFSSSDDVVSMGGTSMATPITAGGAALVRQYYVDGYHATGVKDEKKGFNPSSALVKATLINSGRPLEGFIEMADTLVPMRPGVGNSEVVVNPKLIEGHGRVTLMDTLSFSSPTLKTTQNLLLGRVDRMRSTNSSLEEEFGDPLIHDGDAHDYCFTVGKQSGSIRLKATLVWTDYPSSPVSQMHLVNNLDLQLKDSKGQTWNGNMPFGSKGRDALNNVEQVTIEEPVEGDYMIRIEGSVSKGPQPYALVISGEKIAFRTCQSSDIFSSSSSSIAANSMMNTVLIGGGMIIAILVAAIAVLGVALYRTYKKTQDFSSKGVRLEDAQEMPTTSNE